MNNKQIEDFIKDGVYYIEEKPVTFIPTVGRVVVKFPPLLNNTAQNKSTTSGLYIPQNMKVRNSQGVETEMSYTYDLLKGCTIVAVNENEAKTPNGFRIGDRVYVGKHALTEAINFAEFEKMHPLFDDTAKRLMEDATFGIVPTMTIYGIIERYKEEVVEEFGEAEKSN
jgi:co-chaperonin GroES (HSP10)